MSEGLPRTPLLEATAAVVCLGLFYVTLLGPMLRGSDLPDLEALQTREEILRRQAKALRKELDSMEGEIASVRDQTIRPGKLPAFIQSLTDLAETFHLSVKSIESNSGGSVGRYERTLVTVEFEAKYADLAAFLRGVEERPVLTGLETFSVRARKGGEGLLDVDLTLFAYSVDKEDPVPERGERSSPGAPGEEPKE